MTKKKGNAFFLNVTNINTNFIFLTSPIGNQTYLEKKKKNMNTQTNFVFFLIFRILQLRFQRDAFFFSKENSVDSKYSLLWRFFLLIKCYRLPMGLITFRSEHGWNRLTVFFNIISKNLEIYDIFVHRCPISEKCAMRRGAKMFVAKVSINIWDHAYLAQEQF